MDAFTRAVEALADQPIKGELPSKDEISLVASIADSFQKDGSRIENGRKLPSQQEIEQLVAAMTKK
jgi:hypothetical protein